MPLTPRPHLATPPFPPQVAPRAKVHILDNCTHWVHSDRPDDLQRILRDWMADNPLPGQQQAAKK